MVDSSTNATSTVVGFKTITGSGWWYEQKKTTSRIKAQGDGQEHNNIQPYIVTYMWKRIN